MADKDTKKATKAEAGRRGAAARVEATTAERRSEIARNAAVERWSIDMPRAVNEGILKIGDTEIECAVLETGMRLLSQRAFLSALGRSQSIAGGTGGGDGLPPFLAADNLKPFIDDELRVATTPIVYRNLRGGRAFGYNALLLPKVCEVYLRLNDEGQPIHMQRPVIRAAYLLMRGLAHVGIIALVDKATGYDERTSREELIRILEKYVAPELLPWVRRFPSEFFREMYRINGWTFNEATQKRTPLVGRLINKYIYDQLPPGVHEELRRRNPVTDRGYRKYKHFQFLSEDTGVPHLDDQIRMVMMLMRISETQTEFDEHFRRAFTKSPETQTHFHFVDVSKEPKQITDGTTE